VKQYRNGESGESLDRLIRGRDGGLCRRRPRFSRLFRRRHGAPTAPPFAAYARKPLYSREGANVELITASGRLTGPDGRYGAEGFVRQQIFDLPTFDGVHPVLGCWIVGDEPADMGVREDPGLITTNRSQFVPHMIA
jgi:glutathionylspermidine synthase